MTCVFIHGLGQTPSSWDRVTDFLPTDRQIYRSRLSSIVKNEPITYETLYQAFEDECSRMEALLCLCGISLGAVLALQYTLDNPKMVTSLILIAPQFKMPGLLLDIQNIVFRLIPQTAFHTMGFSKRNVIALTTSMKKIDFTLRLNEIACPSYIICGQKDQANKNAARMLANAIPNAKLSFIENAGHEVNTDAPAALEDLIKKAWFHEV